MPGTAWWRRHGRAGLLVTLLVVTGLAFSYGLGHAPPMRVCTEHQVTAPSGIAAAAPDHRDGLAADAPPGGLAGAGTPVAAWAAADVPAQPSGPLHACLSAAVLLALVVFALAAAPRRSGPRLPARPRRTPAPPAGGSPQPPSLFSLQVLRL